MQRREDKANFGYEIEPSIFLCQGTKGGLPISPLRMNPPRKGTDSRFTSAYAYLVLSEPPIRFIVPLFTMVVCFRCRSAHPLVHRMSDSFYLPQATLISGSHSDPSSEGHGLEFRNRLLSPHAFRTSSSLHRPQGALTFGSLENGHCVELSPPLPSRDILG